MTFQVLSCMEGCLRQSLLHGVVGRAYEKDLFTLDILNPRSFTHDVHQTIDDRPFGGGDGMLMMAEPLALGIEALASRGEGPLMILSPQGKKWTDRDARDAAQQPGLKMICARYGGVDQRLLSAFDIREVSVGDYVLSGGELAAAVVIDSVVRLLPGVLGHDQSAHKDSFADQGLLEAPHFTRPRHWRGVDVPEVLLQGDHKKIEAYKKNLSWLVTLQKRPDIVAPLAPPIRELRQFLQSISPGESVALGLDLELLERRLKERESHEQ